MILMLGEYTYFYMENDLVATKLINLQNGK